ncbi:glutamyl-tRNA(Gln) amidotransferase subunit A [Cordyceps fumosorosea ARSEF 2679]|uniref:Glutamyl-tRNA(Gln) amidotransferase subunit A n=1 Tax=Cordyceps fumosorosea (strain ARSEF 2679) TaxID=1081104 RepID=A0A167WNS5_CORFA|nr:glutamyl-tRNA(Gln) amidotransferase subunit A [Cordyceps fumosorosea ARSEF 2679]OAA64024.1 glutamyl-tRNA(Gln) amidotransferase subunit A [Cordyceps fumosorosea ARSEF 2679]
MRLCGAFSVAIVSLLLHTQDSFATLKHDFQLPLLLDATLDELRTGLDAGRFTSMELTKAYIARIREVNEDLHAVTEINPDALDIAAELDRVRALATGPLHPLHGIPILVKNNIGTADKMNNTAGSTALLGAKLKQDSTVVSKLREAGVVILGKSNLSQWAGSRSLQASNGWSAHGGQTIGAYFPEQDPDGSSSGSAVASSIGLAWASLGTETWGSICDPAHANNIVGIKPTVGLTSRFLVIPISEHQDTVGPMARTVKDAAYLLQTIAGPDGKDNYTEAAPKTRPDYVAACDKDALKGKRLGVPKDYKAMFPYISADVSFEVFESTFQLLRDAGAEVLEHIEMPGVELMKRAGRTGIISGGDFMTDLPKYLDNLETNPNDIHDLSDVRAFTDQSSTESEFDFMLFNMILKRNINNTMPIWWEYYNERFYQSNELGLIGAIRNHTLDAVILPSPIATKVAIQGAPVVSVPMGHTGRNTLYHRNEVDTLNNMGPNHPFGFGFAGDYFSEDKLIGMAYALEQLTQVRKTVKPHIQPKTELKDVAAFKSEEL